METTAVATAQGVPRLRLSFHYDWQGRRVRKVVESFHDTSWVVTSDTRFLYDGWNLVAEFQMSPRSSISPLPSSLQLLRSYLWCLDLSGTPQGAGGVGGLLFVKSYPSTISNLPSPALQAPTYDGNGNITAYVDVATRKLGEN